MYGGGGEGGNNDRSQNSEWRVSRIRAEASAEQRFQDFEALLQKEKIKERKEKKKEKKEHKRKKEKKKDKHKKKHKKRRKEEDEEFDWVESKSDVSERVVEKSIPHLRDNAEASSREAWMLAPPKRERLTSGASETEGTISNNAEKIEETRDWRTFAPTNRERMQTTTEVAEERGARERKYLNMDYENESSEDRSASRQHSNHSKQSSSSLKDSTFAGLRSTSSSSPSLTSQSTHEHTMPTLHSAIEGTTNVQVETTVDINYLTAQAIKADLKGDKETYKKLMDQIETLKSKSSTVFLGSVDERGMLKFAADKESESSRKRQKRDKNQDDNEVDLRTLMEREKRCGVEDMDMGMANAILRNTRGKEMSEEDWDTINPSSLSNKKISKDKLEAMLKQKAVKSLEKLEKCWFCYDNPKIAKHLIISLGEHVYLALPKAPVVKGHCLIIPMKHAVSFTDVDENVTIEAKKFMRGLVAMFARRKKEPVFLETAINLKRQNHTYIECFPIPIADAVQAPMYFKKEIVESESEWSQHKKLIDTSEKGLSRSVAKGFPYFHVQFGDHGGYAHVIEDEQRFPKNFGKEIVGGILGLNRADWARPARVGFEGERQQVLEFLKEWEPFDWTTDLEGGEY